jgi:sterol 14alpha-demethylase
LYVPWIEEEAKNFFEERWGASKEVELMNDFSEATILTSTRCLQGAEIRKIAHEFNRLFLELDGGLNPIGFFFPNLPFPGKESFRSILHINFFFL